MIFINETPSGCVKESIGFKTVEIQGDVLKINGKKIKFKGVNHHDTSPRNGYTMIPDEIEKDILILQAIQHRYHPHLPLPAGPAAIGDGRSARHLYRG